MADNRIIEDPLPRKPEPAVGSSATLEAVDGWAQRNLGGVQTVLHEVASDLIHLDVHVCPNDPKGCLSLLTSGMSDRPMPAAEKWKRPPFAELLIRLPRDWRAPQLWRTISDFRTADTWPIGLLKWLARYPHDYNSALGFGDTVVTSNPPVPLHESVRFTGVLILPPGSPAEPTATSRDGREIHFYVVHPLLPDELAFKCENGVNPLLEKFGAAHLSEIVDVRRRSVLRPKRWFPR